MAKAKEDEEFGAFESKVDEVMNILKFMSSDDIQDQQVGISMADR